MAEVCQTGATSKVHGLPCKAAPCRSPGQAPPAGHGTLSTLRTGPDMSDLMRHCATHYRQPLWAILGSLHGQLSGSSFDPSQSLLSLQSRGDGRACAVETAYMRGARRSTTRGGLIFLCSIQQSRPTRGRPGYIESYPNPFLTNGKPSRRPAVTAHMPHVPPEHPNLHSRSATASERLGFPSVRNGFRMRYVPPTGSRY